MASHPDLFFALYNCPAQYRIRVKAGEIIAMGEGDNLFAKPLKMDLRHGNWVDPVGLVHSPLKMPPQDIMEWPAA